MSHHLFQPIFCFKFSCLIWCILEQIYYFLISHYYTYIIYLRLSIVFFLSFGVWTYISFFRCFFRYFFIIFICKCLWIFFLWIFWNYNFIFLSQLISNFLPSFWRYISFFRFFFIMPICNCFQIILLLIVWNFCNFVAIWLQFLAILLPMKSSVAFAVFLLFFFKQF